VTLDDVLTLLAALERAGVRYAVFGFDEPRRA
jgi:hypothetical protein